MIVTTKRTKEKYQPSAKKNIKRYVTIYLFNFFIEYQPTLRNVNGLAHLVTLLAEVKQLVTNKSKPPPK